MSGAVQSDSACLRAQGLPEEAPVRPARRQRDRAPASGAPGRQGEFQSCSACARAGGRGRDTMTLGCPLCSAPMFRGRDQISGLPGGQRGLDDGGSMCPGLGCWTWGPCPGSWGLSCKGNIQEQEGRKWGGGGRRGREKGWDRPQLGVSSLWDWPRNEDIWPGLAERSLGWSPWLGLGFVWWWW